MKTRSTSGQAAAELAVALVALSSVLILAIHFAQVSMWSLKVVEAGNFGLWDTTARKQHRLEISDWTAWTGAVATASVATQLTYTNFDSAGAKVFSDHNAITAQCVPAPVAGSMTMTPQASRYMPGIYPNGDSAVSCSAKLLVWDVRVPARYLNGTGSAWRSLPMNLCSAGPAMGASCPGKFSVLLDDWGLAGPLESGPCYLTSCSNTAYHQLVQNTFNKGGISNSAGALAAWISGGVAPVNETQFFMSFVGTETTFQDTLPGEHQGAVTWETTPFTYSPGGADRTAWGVRGPCFLGLGASGC